MRRVAEQRRTIAGASNAEINRELSLLKRMFTLALQAGKLLARPHIPMLAEHNVRSGCFERDQSEDVRKRLPTDLQLVASFAYLTGSRINSEVLTLEWRQVDLQAGVCSRWLPAAHPHDFRRTAVRNFERAGVPRSAAMSMVGHKTESIYRRYAIVDAGALRDAAARIDDATGTIPGTTSTEDSNTATAQFA